MRKPVEPIRFNVTRTHLRQLFQNKGQRIVVAIGVANGAEARQLHHTIYDLYAQKAVPDFIGGFIAYVSGYLCAAMLGLPDLGYTLRSEMVRQTDLIEQATWMAALQTGSPALPIGVDGDTGYGSEPSSILLTCRQIHKQGGQYIQLEDQRDINKSCGHMEGAGGQGKLLISAEDMIRLRIRPAVAYARQQDDFSVMARTDAIAVEGYKAALDRAARYVEAGADFLFVEAPENDKQLRDIAAEFKTSACGVLANMIERSPKTPYKSPLQLHKMGYDLALYCVGSLLAGRAAQQRYYHILGRGKNVLQGADESGARWFGGFNTIIGREQTEAWNRFFHES
jgi:2-methylisocitrate lyase-like PEP mutase family enzyme